ncbi:4-carboxy-4-hydroxy-2-oxoadipate aldolase/oxaloacetate decarboxylase [Spirochaetia bacterium]|nr:4-carboxy-4-hydroxy-2-oxoadipate aldolase/oxaloacetate decarboxylase [Spirochaetia bacterium]
MNDKELIKLVRKCRLADLGDGMDALGLVNMGTMRDNMRPLRPGISFAGFAYTVKLVPAKRDVKVCKDIQEYYAELDKWCSDTYTFNGGLTPESCPDMVVVVDMGGYPGGLWGSEIGAASMIKGVAGVVLDGACRDSEESNIEGVKVFCTRRTFNHVYGRLENAGVNVPIECAGVSVKPRDIVCADDDGVLVIPYERAEDVLKFAIPIMEDDQKKRADHYKKLGLKPDASLDRMNTK